MDVSLGAVIGMTVAYAASFAGMLCAYLYYRKHKRKNESDPQDGGEE